MNAQSIPVAGKSFLKLSTDGPDGSGKTCTMAQLAVGLAKEFADGGAVHVFDSSDRWSAWKVHIFDVEKIPLVITVGNSLAALQESMDHFLDEGGAVYVADDLTVPWMEGLASFAYENGNLPFDRRQQLVNEWRRFVDPFQSGEFDAIACGRLGYWWENVEDPDTGDMKLQQGDAKFNAGGGQNFGYECVLECELRRRKRKLLGLFRGKLAMEYVCDVVKDANSIINGQQFTFSDFKDGYKPGDYKKVLDCFRPHIEFRRKLGKPRRYDGSTKDLIVRGKTQWARSTADRTALLEDFENNLKLCFPGGEKKSKEHEMYTNLTLEFLNSHMSRSRMADPDETSTEQIERDLFIVRAMRKRMQGGEKVTDQNSLTALLMLSQEDVEHPGNGKTLYDLMTAASVDGIAALPRKDFDIAMTALRKHEDLAEVLEMSKRIIEEKPPEPTPIKPRKAQIIIDPNMEEERA